MTPDFSLQNGQGQAISGASVCVYTEPFTGVQSGPTCNAGTPATLYGNSAGTGTAICGATGGQLTQPLRTDGFGHACAYASPGLYTVCYWSAFTGGLCYQDQTATVPGGAYCPLGGCTITGALNSKTLSSWLYADQWQTSGGSNNGIANALSSGCSGLSYPCSIQAPPLYATTEAQPFGGVFGDPQTTGPKSTDPVTQFLDGRYGVPQWVFNRSVDFDNRHGANPSFVMNFTGDSALNGTSTHPAIALNLQTNWWAGGRNFYNDKMDSGTLQVVENHYTELQGGTIIGVGANCYGNGDCLGPSVTTFSWGGPSAGSDEGNEDNDDKNLEATSVPTATVSGTPTVASDGSTTIVPTAAVNGTTWGEGRLVIDTTKSTRCNLITNISNGTGGLQITHDTSCNLDAAFGVSTQTTLTADIVNPGSTNTFPQSNVNAAVASSTGFLVGDVACIYDNDMDCAKVTAVPDGTHVTLATVRRPHASGAWIVRGGLTGYCEAMDADNVGGSAGLNGVSYVFGVGSLVRNCIPIVESKTGGITILQGGQDFTTAQSDVPTTRAYKQMAGSGGTCSVTVSGGQIASVTATGGTGYLSTLNPPQLVLSGITYTTAPVIYVSGISGGALTSGAIYNAGAGITGTPTCTVSTLNPSTIYPAGKTYSVYDPVAGAVGTSLYTEPWRVTPAANDAIEQPHWHNMHVVGDFKFAGQLIPTNAGEGTGGYGYSMYGIYHDSDSPASWHYFADPSLFKGYPGTPNILGRGQLVGPNALHFLDGPARAGVFMNMPPFAPDATATDPGDFNPGAFMVDCAIATGGAQDCTKWTTPYWLMGASTVNGFAGAHVTPSTGLLGLRGTQVTVETSNLSLPAFPLTTTGGLVSGIGQNWVEFSNDLTNAAWFVASGTWTRTNVADPLGQKGTVTKLVVSANATLANISGTDLTPGSTFTACADMLAGDPGDVALITFDTSAGPGYTALSTTAWQTVQFTGVASNPASNHWKAGIETQSSAETIYVTNVRVGPGTSCQVPQTTTSSQVTTNTVVTAQNGINLCLQNGTNCPASGILGGTTASIGGGALALNQCATGTATVTGATTGMHVYGITPAADPNGSTAQNYDWYGTVTSANTVTVKVCALVAGTPAATTYGVLVY